MIYGFFITLQSTGESGTCLNRSTAALSVDSRAVVVLAPYQLSSYMDVRGKGKKQGARVERLPVAASEGSIVSKSLSMYE